jgi:hypothetical protein
VSSFTSAFKPILVAIGVIAAVEAAVMVLRHPDDVERSNFLTFSYLRPEIGQRLIVYEQLHAFGQSSPDIIQIGDSSGFYGVNPDIVERYLGGLSYVNLSCCTVLGFGGHYAIAHFMLRHNPSIKAVVLYVTPFDFFASNADNSFAEPVQNSFDSLRSYIMPPSIALRREITEATYTLAGMAGSSPNDNRDLERLLRFVRDNKGWLPENDIRLSGRALDEYWHGICGPEHLYLQNDGEQYYSHDLLRGRQSRLTIDIARLADLAARYRAKLILIAQALPCAFAGTAFDARARDLDRLRSEYPNLVVVPSPPFFRLPTDMFSSIAHLRVGNEIANSRRVGLAVAHALGAPAILGDGAAIDPEPPFPIADKNTPLTWSTDRFDDPAWMKEEVTTLPTADGTRITESTAFGSHRIRTQVSGIEPSRPYIFSILVKPGPNRTLWFELADGGQPDNDGRTYFDLDRLSSSRAGNIIDLDIEALPDGWFRCWASMRFHGNSVAANVVLGAKTAVLYKGDGESSITIRKAALRPGARLTAATD